MSEFQVVDGDIKIADELSKDGVVDVDWWRKEMERTIVIYSIRPVTCLCFDKTFDPGIGRRGITFAGLFCNLFTTCETVVAVNAELQRDIDCRPMSLSRTGWRSRGDSVPAGVTI